MKKYVIDLSKFILLLAIIYPLLVFAWGKLVPASLQKNLQYKKVIVGQLNLRLQEADTIRDVDVLILGSSRAYRGYDPRIFGAQGLKTFVLGSSAQTPIQTEVLFHKYIDRLNPKFVIIDIYPTLLSSDGVESSLDLIANNCIDYNSIKMFAQQKNILILNSLLYSSLNKITSTSAQEVKDKNGDKYISGGYTESFRTFKAILNLNKKIDIELSNTQMDALKRIINNLKERNIKYGLVQSPITIKKYNYINNNEHIDKQISRLGDYYNFNLTSHLSNKYFYDENHLNQHGVNAFNQRLLKTLDINIIKSN